MQIKLVLPSESNIKKKGPGPGRGILSHDESNLRGSGFHLASSSTAVLMYFLRFGAFTGLGLRM